MNERLQPQMTFTKERLIDAARAYATRLYGPPVGEGMQDEDKWLECFGLLCAFIDEQFEEKP